MLRHQSAIDEINVSNQPDIPLELISKEEIQGSIYVMKNRKAPGEDSISAEVLTTGGDEMINFSHMLFNKIWRKENPSLEWSKII